VYWQSREDTDHVALTCAESRFLRTRAVSWGLAKLLHNFNEAGANPATPQEATTTLLTHTCLNTAPCWLWGWLSNVGRGVRYTALLDSLPSSYPFLAFYINFNILSVVLTNSMELIVAYLANPTLDGNQRCYRVHTSLSVGHILRHLSLVHTTAYVLILSYYPKCSNLFRFSD
jgi:hypothetical protein